MKKSTAYYSATRNRITKVGIKLPLKAIIHFIREICSSSMREPKQKRKKRKKKKNRNIILFLFYYSLSKEYIYIYTHI